MLKKKSNSATTELYSLTTNPRHRRSQHHPDTSQTKYSQEFNFAWHRDTQTPVLSVKVAIVWLEGASIIAGWRNNDLNLGEEPVAR